MVYKKYGEESSNPNVESPSPVSGSNLPPYYFRPVPPDEDTAPPSKHNMRTRRANNNSASTNGKKKERTCSPDVETSSISSSTTGVNRSDRRSPNNTDDDKDIDDKKSKDSSSKSKKRRFDGKEESSGKKKKDRSDSESESESGSVSCAEGLGNEGESDTNIQEELSDSSRPSSPTSSIEPVRPQPIPATTSPDLCGDKPSNTSTVSSVVNIDNNSPTPSNAAGVLTKDNSVNPLSGNTLHIDNRGNSPSSKPVTSQSLPLIGIGAIQQPNPFSNPATLPPVSTGVIGFASTATPNLPSQQLSAISSTASSSTSSIPSPSNHLRSLQHPNQFIRPPIGVGPASGASHIGTITNAGNHAIGSISANTSVACNFSPLVIPSPALSRASSTGTFIPRTELAIPSLSNSTSSATDSIATTIAKSSTLVSSTDSSSSTSQRSQPNNPTSGNHNNPNTNPINPSGNSNNNIGNNPSATASTNSTPSNPFSRMQQEQSSSSSSSGDDQDKKPPSLPHPVPPHLPPTSFLPGHPGAMPFSPFHHYYYPQHPGAPHLPPHLAALHSAAAGSATSSSSSSTSSGPSPLTAPPPVPSLVPIKKEVHSPPPPLKSSSDSKSQSDILSSPSSSSSIHALHRSLPPPQDGAPKLPPGFPQSVLPSTAPLPPPPLTVIDHRDGTKPTDDLSKSLTDHYSKDSNSSSSGGLRGLNPSPHRPEGSLPPSQTSILHQSRMDNNLSILSESREIGLKGGINPSASPHPSSSSSSSSSHPQLTSIKEESNPSSHHHPSLPSAAFQPYPHHHHHHHHHPHHIPNTHHPGLPTPPSQPPPSHGPASSSSSSATTPSSSSVLQVPQPHLPANDHHHPHHHPHHLPPHHLESNLHSVSGSASSSSSRPSELISNIKKEPVPPEEIHVDDDDDDPMGGSTTPGPTPTICNREFYKSNSAIFVKVFDRGERNQCSRTDFVFKPLPGSFLAKKSEEKIKKVTHSSTSSISAREEKKRVETPPRATSASESQKSTSSSNCNNPCTSGSNHHPGHGPPTYQDRHTPRQFTDTPALRQLHEYARPHVLNSDPRAGPYSLAGLQHHPHVDPLIGYRLGVFPPGSRERLELELERDKRERDAREREMRERELREMELRDKMELKPGLERLLPPGAASQLTDAASWLDLQRRMGFPPTAAGPLVPPPGHSPSAVGSHVPGVYPPSSLASDLLAREREKLDRFGLAANLPQLAADMSYASAVERLSQERQAAERHAADRERLVAYTNDPGTRLQLASVAAATQHAHTHTHAHSHTHLHLHQQEVAAHAQAVAQAQAHGLTPPAFPLSLGGHAPSIYPPHHPLAAAQGAADAAAAVGGPNAGSAIPPTSSANPLPVLPPGVMHHPLLAGISNREELLQREIYSRSGHFIDPALAHQLSAQAAAHEALQRQIAMERERFGSSGHLPH